MTIDADIARQCIQEGLIDEIRVHLAPILLGDGIRFFHWPAAPHAIRLEPTDVTQSGQVPNLRFRVLE
jgi:dihydrofolate reductase